MNDSINISLLLSQSYKDHWEDYQRSLVSETFTCWDYIVLTASDEFQANGYLAQLDERKKIKALSSRTKFLVVPDECNERIGSGGSTLSVLKKIAEVENSNDFSGLRILVIHSGGDSKRVPQYSSLGKLFSPVPRTLPDGRPSTLFDEIIISMSSVSTRMSEGMLLLSGDVLLLFNPLLIDISGQDAAAISFKEEVNIGKNHGVFKCGNNSYVQQFLHKQPVEKLRALGAVNENDLVDIDTGAIIFGVNILSSLYSLISQNGIFDEEKYRKFVNSKVRLSLYGDFLYPLAEESTFEGYLKEAPEGTFCEELTEARTEIWGKLHDFRLKILRVAPAKFVHFGTTKEVMELMNSNISDYSELGWEKNVNSVVPKNCAGYNSIVSLRATVGHSCFFEVSHIHKNTVIGDNSLLSYVDIFPDTVVPSNVVIHGIKQQDGTFIARIWGTEDNPKEGTLFGISLEEFAQKYNISQSKLWSNDSHILWNADIYPVCKNMKDAVQESLNLYNILHGKGDVTRWISADKKSLCSGFHNADSKAIISWNKHMTELIQMERIAQLIYEDQKNEIKSIQKNGLSSVQSKWLEEKLSDSEFSEKIRLLYAIGDMLGGADGAHYHHLCFQTIRNEILSAYKLEQKELSASKILSPYTVKRPLRVNWGGGWSDTPPYCNEHGGTVLNAAILLNGKLPVEVTVEKIKELKIVFDSRDMDVHGEFSEINELQDTGNPFDSFALQKACLLACGIIPQNGGSLNSVFDVIGGGFIMKSEVTDVPKGSGLGTSSILAVACVEAILGFFGIEYTTEELYSYVLCMEQLMSTGGGWQDQIGGMSAGIKFITSEPGTKQKIKITPVTISEKTKSELQNRFAIIYTGQRRLARNLLRDVIGRYICNNSESLFALNEIQRIAALMRFELERGNINAFAYLMNEHWRLSQIIDKNSSNTLISLIFDSIDDLIDGKMVCGAGGGGFLQVILKDGCSKDDLQNRLKKVFADSNVYVGDSTILF